MFVPAASSPYAAPVNCLGTTSLYLALSAYDIPGQSVEKMAASQTPMVMTRPTASYSSEQP